MEVSYLGTAACCGIVHDGADDFEIKEALAQGRDLDLGSFRQGLWGCRGGVEGVHTPSLCSAA
jgi:hypothetical protein